MLHKKACVDSTLGSPDWTVRGNEYTVHVVPPGSLQPLKWGRLYHFWFNHYIEILTKSFFTEFLGAKKLRSIEDEKSHHLIPMFIGTPCLNIDNS